MALRCLLIAAALFAIAIGFDRAAPTVANGPWLSRHGGAVRAPAFAGYDETDDLRGFVERSAPRLDDPVTMYYVSQALEECHTTSANVAEPESSWSRAAAGAALAAPCRGFEGRAIDPRDILALLEEAARQGEPHARARMLLFRDIAAPKDEVIAELPALLATFDPAVVRDVGAFLAKGEETLRYGGDTVDASVAAIAWELAACDLGYPCGPASRLVLTQCAFTGTCDAYRYDEAIARQEMPARMEEAQRLRAKLLRALLRRDWSWLGLE